MSPLGNAMRLVHRKQGNFPTPAAGYKVFARKAFRG